MTVRYFGPDFEELESVDPEVVNNAAAMTTSLVERKPAYTRA